VTESREGNKKAHRRGVTRSNLGGKKKGGKKRKAVEVSAGKKEENRKACSVT